MSGSLQIKNGMFYAVLNFKDNNGSRKQKWISTGLAVKGNKRRAEQFLNEIIAENDDTYRAPSKCLFCDFVADWIELRKPDVQATTYDGYIHMLNRHIYPYFKSKGLTVQKIEPMHIAKYYKEKLDEGLNPNTVIKHHAIIRSALQYALKQRIVKENAADMVDKPKRKKFFADYYNEKEINILFAAIKDTPIETPAFLACYFGLRRSEVLGLRWDCVDFENRTITIRHKVVRSRIDGKLKFQCSNDLKTQSSYRTLPLDENTHTYFISLQERVCKNRNIYGNSYQTQYADYICLQENGDLLKPDYVSDVFKKIIVRNSLKPIRFHDLRHSCASLLLHLGYDMKDIQEWLGHSNFQTTANIYAHVDPKNKRQMIDEVGNKLKM